MTKDYSSTEVVVSTTQLSLHKLKHAYEYDRPIIYALIPVDNWVHAQQFMTTKFSEKYEKSPPPYEKYYVPNIEEALEYFYTCCVEYQTKY